MCQTCKKSSNGYLKNLKPTKLRTSNYHYIIVAVTLAVLCMYFVNDVVEDGNKFIFYLPHEDHFRRPPSVFLNSIEYSQDIVKERKQSMAYQMDYSCEATNNDVIFSFQYVRNSQNETYNDHIFMLCNSHRAFANTEILYNSDEKIMCMEEYAGIVKKKIRSKNVTIKAIDIQLWQTIQYSSSSEHESCTIAHAVEMLNKKWSV